MESKPELQRFIQQVWADRAAARTTAGLTQALLEAVDVLIANHPERKAVAKELLRRAKSDSGTGLRPEAETLRRDVLLLLTRGE